MTSEERLPEFDPVYREIVRAIDAAATVDSDDNFVGLDIRQAAVAVFEIVQGVKAERDRLRAAAIDAERFIDAVTDGLDKQRRSEPTHPLFVLRAALAPEKEA